MMFNLLRNALLAGVVHTAMGFMLATGNASPAVAVIPACAMPISPIAQAARDASAPALNPIYAGAHS